MNSVPRRGTVAATAIAARGTQCTARIRRGDHDDTPASSAHCQCRQLLPIGAHAVPMRGWRAAAAGSAPTLPLCQRAPNTLAHASDVPVMRAASDSKRRSSQQLRLHSSPSQGLCSETLHSSRPGGKTRPVNGRDLRGPHQAPVSSGQRCEQTRTLRSGR